jgi:hypothetical protein
MCTYHADPPDLSASGATVPNAHLGAVKHELGDGPYGMFSLACHQPRLRVMIGIRPPPAVDT